MPDSQPDALASVISAAQTLFPDLEFVAPGGILELHKKLPAVDRLRFRLPKGQFLHLQSIGVTADGVDDLAEITTLTASSWYKDFEGKFDLPRFLDFDSPSGTLVHTRAKHSPWIQLSFARPIDITSIRLRNVSDANAVRERGMKILKGSPGEEALTLVYDGTQRAAELVRVLRSLSSVASRDIGEELGSMLPALGRTIAGDYWHARSLEKAVRLSDNAARHYRKVINARVLNARSMELTTHGLKRSFRFWSEREKKSYINFALKVTTELRRLTPNACFGFGAALAVVRDGDLIPHDDDLDIIVGFEPHEAATLPDALKLVEDFLTPLGYTVDGEFSAHKHVGLPGRRKLVDVFVGLFEDGDTISWYPGRRGSLSRDIMFPTSEGQMLGIACPLPRKPELYLERVYGPGWRQPDPGFSHTWDQSQYADLRAPRPAAQ
jgi:hypothetical protein